MYRLTFQLTIEWHDAFKHRCTIGKTDLVTLSPVWFPRVMSTGKLYNLISFSQIHVANGWKKLSVNGVFHHMNTVARYSGIFNLDIIEPKYKGETLLTKNSNVYPLMSKVGSFKFVKITVNHTSLPEVFQDDKPQFEWVNRSK